MTTAAVIGSGLAGPVVAMGLARAGIDAVVFEAQPGGGADVGAFLTLQVNGIDALRAVDAGHVLDGLGFGTPLMRIRSGSGKELRTVTTGMPLTDGTVAQTVRRADLCRALREEALRRGVRIEQGTRVTRVEPDGSGVRAGFADGSEFRADMLVGAGGIRSRVRAAIDPDAPPARYVPLLNIGGFAPAQDVGTGPGDFEMIVGKRCFFGYAVAPDGGSGGSPTRPAATSRRRGSCPGPPTRGGAPTWPSCSPATPDRPRRSSPPPRTSSSGGRPTTCRGSRAGTVTGWS